MRHLVPGRRLPAESLQEMMKLFVVAALLLSLLLWLHLI